jgi:hypothetical protein
MQQISRKSNKLLQKSGNAILVGREPVPDVVPSVSKVYLTSHPIIDVVISTVMEAVAPQVVHREALNNNNCGELAPEIEGCMKTLMKALVKAAQALEYGPKHYHAPVGRKLWQDHQIKMHKEFLRRPENAGKNAIITIDMKGKTPTAENREEQSHDMGAVGMSLQGGMLHFFLDGVEQQHFVDLVYNQRSNQTLQEAMTALSAQQILYDERILLYTQST